MSVAKSYCRQTAKKAFQAEGTSK